MRHLFKFPSEWMVDHYMITCIYEITLFFDGETAAVEWIISRDEISPAQAIYKVMEHAGGDYKFSAKKIQKKDWNTYRRFR